MYVNITEKNTDIGFSANIELFELLSLTENAFDHLDVTTLFKTRGEDICDHRGEAWRVCEYLVTTTGLSMHYQLKDT